MRALITAFLLLVSSTAWADPRPSMSMDQCKEHLPFQEPYIRRMDTKKICREGYALQHDNKAKIPIWVSYNLTPQRAVGCFARTGDWDADPSLEPGKRAEPKDYAKSGYDIGHMANNSDMRWSKQTEVESNVLSNAAPQLPSLNRGPWKQLEDQTRAWVLSKNSDILVIVGPIYDTQAPSTIGPGHVTIPSAFYKVLVDQKSKEVLAFIYPATADRGAPGAFRVSLAEVQRKTRINFYIPRGYNLVPMELWKSDAKSARKAKEVTCSIKP